MLRSCRFASCFAIFALTAAHALAQRCGAGNNSTIATTRPQVTGSSIVVPCGALQFENGVAETSAGGQRGYDLPETFVRLGVANKTEVRFTLPEYFWNLDTGNSFASGLADSSIGVKRQIGPLHGLNLSTIATLSLPTGAQAISSHGYDASIAAPYSVGFAKVWTAAGMFSVLWPTQNGRHNTTGQASFYLDRQLLAPLDAWFEYAGEFPQRGGPQHSIDFGTAYKPTPHQQIDFHASFGLSAAVPDHSIGLGYSFRFQVFGIREK